MHGLFRPRLCQTKALQGCVKLRAPLFLLLSFSAFFLTSPLSQTATANPQLQNALLRAEQARIALNYAQLYRLARTILSIDRNEVRGYRYGMMASLPLAKFRECLQFGVAIPLTAAIADDLHHLGECAEAADQLGTIRKYLQAATRIELLKDAAQFWIAVAAYKDEDFETAYSILRNVATLPTRYVSKKEFLLERSKDFLTVQSQRSHDKTSGAPQDSKNSRSPRQEEKRRQQPSPETTRRTSVSQAARPGSYTQVSGRILAGMGLGAEEQVDTLAGTQAAFDADARQAQEEIRDVNTALIEESAGTLFLPLGNFSTTLRAGFLNGGRDDAGSLSGSDYAVFAKIHAAWSGRELPYQSVAGTLRHPSSFSVVDPSGLGLRLGASATFAPNTAFSFATEVFADRVLHNFSEQYGQSGIQGTVNLGPRAFKARLLGHWSLLQGDDLAPGGSWISAGLDLSIPKLGFFELNTPDGHAIMTYHLSQASSGSETTGMTRIIAIEGDYLEFNLAPKFTFSESFASRLWFRYVQGSTRTYRSAETIKLQTELGDNSAKQPDAQYNSTLSEWHISLSYLGFAWGEIYGGVAAAFYSTSFVEDLPITNPNFDVSPIVYADLLDVGRDNLTYAYVGCSWTFGQP